MKAKIEHQWTTQAGLPAVVTLCIRDDGSKSHRCGYVATPAVLQGRDYSDFDFDVHGGLTFSGDLKHAGIEDSHWWFGFDCLHLGDREIEPLEPYTRLDPFLWPHGTVKSLDFCIKQCESLAKQLQTYASNSSKPQGTQGS